MDDIIRCYADVLSLTTTLRLPPEPFAPEQRMPRAGRSRWGYRAVRAATRLVAMLARHFELNGMRSVLVGKRCFRRIGG